MQTFRFKTNGGSVLGEIDFFAEVITPGQPSETIRVRMRTDVSDYHRTISRLNDREWHQEVVCSLQLLHRSGASYEALPDGLVEAFNQWQLGAHQTAMTRVEEILYGIPGLSAAERDRLMAAPLPATAARYVHAKTADEESGWVLTSGDQAGQLAHVVHANKSLQSAA